MCNTVSYFTGAVCDLVLDHSLVETPAVLRCVVAIKRLISTALIWVCYIVGNVTEFNSVVTAGNISTWSHIVFIWPVICRETNKCTVHHNSVCNTDVMAVLFFCFLCMCIFVWQCIFPHASVYIRFTEHCHVCASTCKCRSLYTHVSIIPHYFHTICAMLLSLFSDTSFDNRAVTPGSKSSLKWLNGRVITQRNSADTSTLYRVTVPWVFIDPRLHSCLLYSLLSSLPLAMQWRWH